MTIKVLIADDHKLFRQGLISIIETREDFVEVIGEAENGEEAVRLAGELHPDVVLMDIYMPHGDGLTATKEILASYPGIAVVMLTSSEKDEHLYEAIKMGVSGYLLKSLDAKDLFELLAGITRGETAMTKAMATRLLKGVAKHSMEVARGEDALTERELIVLRLVASGDSNFKIAEKLSISVNTVKGYLKNILAKLQLENRTQAAAFAIKSGLILNSEENQSKKHPKG